MDVGPDRSSDNKESIREYTCRWCETAAQANPSLFGERDDQFVYQHLQGPVF
jgi:hypothetical protein